MKRRKTQYFGMLGDATYDVGFKRAGHTWIWLVPQDDVELGLRTLGVAAGRGQITWWDVAQLTKVLMTLRKMTGRIVRP